MKNPINSNLFDPYLESMNILNEISIDYPNAVSFGSGRPDQQLFKVSDFLEGLNQVKNQMNRDGSMPTTAFDSLGQYNKTNGIINDAIARLIKKDEQITVTPEDIIITNGAQEAMAIVLNGLFSRCSSNDVLLTGDPSYVGFMGYAKILGIDIVSVPREYGSIDLDQLDNLIRTLKSQGKHPKVLYEVPDFHNPTGTYMPLDKRERLIELAGIHDFYIAEDNPYGYFRYCTEKIPTLKALDDNQRVLYIGSFSKTMFPSLRMGYLVADQHVEDAGHTGKTIKLVEEFKKIKSFLSVNTSTLLQAMVGEILRQHDYTLIEYCRAKVGACQRKRDALVNTLDKHFRHLKESGVLSWNVPSGGFFLVVDIPFQMTRELLIECVRDYQVIVCPIFMFCLDESIGNDQIRLSFSNLSVDEIETGVKRLAEFIHDKTGTLKTNGTGVNASSRKNLLN